MSTGSFDDDDSKLTSVAFWGRIWPILSFRVGNFVPGTSEQTEVKKTTFFFERPFSSKDFLSSNDFLSLNDCWWSILATLWTVQMMPNMKWKQKKMIGNFYLTL